MSIPSRQIEMGEARLFEDFRLASSSPARIREIGVVGSAYESVLASDFTYVSTPITSGAALYRAMDELGVGTIDDLRRDRDAFRRLVMDVNLAAAEQVAHAMLSFGGAVIAPAAFEARSLDWDQDAYMGLWLDTIERKATRIAMVDGWEYSNGGVEEYLQALLMQAGRRDRSDIEIVDARGLCLRHDVAIDRLATAIDDLTTRGFSPVVLVRTLHRVIALHDMIENESRYGQSTDACGRSVFRISSSFREAQSDGIASSIREGRRTLAPLLSMLDPGEREPRSSLELAPGLVRTEERQEMSNLPARVVGTDRSDDASPGVQ